MKKLFAVTLLIMAIGITASAQLSLPRESQRQEIVQTVGDTTMKIVYHRPNVKNRKIWGGLVPYGQVWRSGANENTTIEFSRDVIVNGQPLPAGKYGFHSIPGEGDWVLIFSKASDQWGSFTYDPKLDALRLTVKPLTVSDSRETLAYQFDDITSNSARVVLGWERVRVPFEVSIGDVAGRTLAEIRKAISARKTDDIRPLNQGAGYVLTFRVKDSYDEALGWVDESIKARKTFGALATRARLLEARGDRAAAIAAGEEAVTFGKAQTPPVDTSDFEQNYLAVWKAGK